MMTCLLFGTAARAADPVPRVGAWIGPSAPTLGSYTFASAAPLAWDRLAAISDPIKEAVRRGGVDLSIVPELTLHPAPTPAPGSTMPAAARGWVTPGIDPVSLQLVPDPEITGAPATPTLVQPDHKPGKALHEQLWFVTLELLTVQTASLAIFAVLPPEVTLWDHPDVRNIGKYAAMGPHFDNDRWGFNFVGHPLSGSEYYLIARNRGAAFWQGMLYSAAWSGFWEYVTEGLYERASIQDLIVTPVAGAVLGELRYQLRQAIIRANPERSKRFPLILATLALDPVETFMDAVPLRYGGSASP